MEGKLNILTAYAIIGLIIALWPVFIKEKVTSAENFQFDGLAEASRGWMWKFLCFALAMSSIALLPHKSIISIILNFGIIAFALSLVSKKFDIFILLITFLVLCISITMLWWCKQGNGLLHINNFVIPAFCFFTFAFNQVFKIEKQSRLDHNFSIKWLIPYILVAAILSFSTGIFHNVTPFYILWVHWSAYISSAQLLLSGAAILHDFPAQYGLGPTTLIASICGSDCWQGMYYIVGFSNLIFSILIATLALALTHRRAPKRFIVLILSLITCFFWTAYPPVNSLPMETPAMGGLRYLPVLTIVTYLFFNKQIEHSKIKIIIAHCLWLIGILWSPESAFYVTCVWCPYYIFIMRTPGNFRLRCKDFINSLSKLTLMVAGLVIFFNIIYRIIYHKLPSLYAYLIYVLHPPLAIPINPYGVIWYFLMGITIGVSALIYLWHKSGDSHLFRSGLLITLMNYSVCSYFLGRSHDAALLYLTPFILLVFLHAIFAVDGQRRLNQILKKASVICLVAMIGWLPAFSWDIWHKNIKENRLFIFDPKFISHSLPFFNRSIKSKVFNDFSGRELLLPEDAMKAIQFIQQKYAEPLTIINSGYFLVDIAPTKVWSAMHGLSNYVATPSPYNRKFLKLTAKSLQRAGWLIIDRKYVADKILADFDIVYQQTNRLEFGTYYAIRYSPK